MRTIGEFTPQELNALIYSDAAELMRMGMSIAPSATYHEETELRWIASSVPHPFVNMISGAELTPDSADEAIQRAIKPFIERDLPCCWLLGDTVRPDDLSARLMTAGFSLVERNAAMAADISTFVAPPMKEDVAVREVLNADDTEVWIDILTQGFVIPREVSALFSHSGNHYGYASSPIRLFLGYYRGEPVSCSMLTLMAGVAGIYCVATTPEARGRGAGMATTAEALSVAHGLGYQMAVLEASEDGYPVYLKLGFKDYGKIIWYLRAGSKSE